MSDERGFVIGLLERAITEAAAGNFIRAQGLVGTAKGFLKQLATDANQGISPFSAAATPKRSPSPIKPGRARDSAARSGRGSTMRVPLAELLSARDLLHPDDAYGSTPAGRWPPQSLEEGDGQ